jgi:hypothetical protein
VALTSKISRSVFLYCRCDQILKKQVSEEGKTPTKITRWIRKDLMQAKRCYAEMSAHNTYQSVWRLFVGYVVCGFVHGQSLTFQGLTQRNRMESKYTKAAALN